MYFKQISQNIFSGLVGVKIDLVRFGSLALIATLSLMLAHNRKAEANTNHQFSQAQIEPSNSSLQSIDFKSDTQWKVYNSEADLIAGIPLGDAQKVCANDNHPANCPVDAMRYGFNIGNGTAWLVDISGLGGANWIWAPGITGATPNADFDEYFFSKDITIPGTPVSGQIKIATDDFVEIRINGQVVGNYGSVVDFNLAGQAQNQVKTFDILPQLKSGTNAVTFWTQNGPRTFAGCPSACAYSQNIAGTVFFGVISYDSRALSGSSKSVSATTVKLGQTVTYTIALSNTSVITPAQVLVTDTLPTKLNYVTDSLTASSGSASYSDGVVNWSGVVPANNTVTVMYQATVPLTTTLGTVFTNTALISSGEDVFTRTAVLNLPLARVYLPAVHRPQVGVLGRVTQNGQSAGGVALQLRFFNGSSWSTWATTTTDGGGNFVFTNPPTLAAGQKMYVRYLNEIGTPERLYIWATADITAYQPNTTVHVGQFDIADVVLVSPPTQTVVSLPYTFQWQARSATPTDSYAVRYFGVLSGDDSFALTVPLGYVNGFTLNGLPPGFATYTPYGWDVLVYSPNGGVGIPYYYRLVAFSNTGTGSQITAQMASQWESVNPLKDEVERK